MNENINDLLVNARKKKKLTRKALAEVSDFKERTIASYERGEREPTNEYINFIEYYCDVDIREKLDKGRKSIAYYDTFDTSKGYPLVKNERKHVYNDNPLITLIFDGSSFPDSMFLETFQNDLDENFNNITLINGIDFQTYKRFFMRDPKVISGFFDNWLKKLKKTHSVIILKNDLLIKGYPLLDDKYFGALWWVSVTKERVIFKALSKNFDFNFNYISEEADEYKIKIRDIEEDEAFSDDFQTYNDEEKKEIRKEFDRLEKEYKVLKDFRLDMTREEFSKLTVIGTEL